MFCWIKILMHTYWHVVLIIAFSLVLVCSSYLETFLKRTVCYMQMEVQYVDIRRGIYTFIIKDFLSALQQYRSLYSILLVNGHFQCRCSTTLHAVRNACLPCLNPVIFMSNLTPYVHITYEQWSKVKGIQEMEKLTHSLRLQLHKFIP